MPKTPSARRQFRRNLKPAFATASIRLFGLLPLRVNRAIGTAIGYLIWWSRGKSVAVSLANISKALPELSPEQQFALTKASVIETAKTAMEVTSTWRQPYTRLKAYVIDIENLSLVYTNGQAKKNCLLLVPHLGNWEFFGTVLPQYLTTTFVYQPSGLQAMDDLINAGRSREGVKLAPSNNQGVGKVLRALRGGESVAILPDQVPERDSGAQLANFFGHQAWTMTLVHKLIQRTQCTVVMAVVKRVAKGYVIVFEQPDESIYSADEMESLNGLNRSVENCVRKIPEQYQWEYKRYRRVEQTEINQD